MGNRGWSLTETVMEPLLQVIRQEQNEERYSRKHIDAKIKKEIQDNSSLVSLIEEGESFINEYMDGSYYESKMNRIKQLREMNIKDLILDIFIGVAYFQRPELYASACAIISSRLNFNNRREAVMTVSELLAVLSDTNAFDITKESPKASLYLVSRIPLSDQLIQFIDESEYLPPMVCEPLELTHNFSSGYLTHNDSLILGSDNHHDGNICLDVLNRMNKVALSLSTEFLCTMEETPSHDIQTNEEQDQWDNFKKQSYCFYSLMHDCGNKFYLTHKVDKRGRIYSCGFHINTQGSSFKKASIELANAQLVQMD